LRRINSLSYGLERLESVVREISPDFVCAEITPTGLEKHNAGKKDHRLSFLPEYIEVILPLREELKYTILPCSAWSKKVNFKTIGLEKMTLAHTENIANYLDTYKGQGNTILVTFGSGHINGIKKHLSTRKDIELIDYRKNLTK